MGNGFTRWNFRSDLHILESVVLTVLMQSLWPGKNHVPLYIYTSVCGVSKFLLPEIDLQLQHLQLA